MPLALLIPLLTPILTEVVKWLMGKVVNEVPPVLTPLISAVGGAVIAVTAQGMPLDAASLIQGAELGLAGTGLHQVTRLTGLTTRSAKTRATDL